VRRVAILLVSVLVILSAVVMIRTTRHSRSARHSPWLQLLSLLNARRPFEPRFTGLPFARWIQVRSGSKSERQAPTPELLLVAALLEKQIQRDQSPLIYKQAAVARLLLNEWDASVSLLESAVAMVPEDGSLRSDLAAAYLVRATATGASRDLVRALDSAKRATVANPEAPEGWFNFGLALEQLGLNEAARQAWQQAAAIGSDEWTREAAWRSGRLPRDEGRAGALAQIEPMVTQGESGAMLQAASTQPDLAGELIERRILRDWAEAVRAHDLRRAKLVVWRARDLARDIRRVTGDTLYLELIAALDSCTGARCADGWLSHLQALEKWERDDYAGARDASDRVVFRVTN